MQVFELVRFCGSVAALLGTGELHLNELIDRAEDSLLLFVLLIFAELDECLAGGLGWGVMLVVLHAMSRLLCWGTDESDLYQGENRLDLDCECPGAHTLKQLVDVLLDRLLDLVLEVFDFDAWHVNQLSVVRLGVLFLLFLDNFHLHGHFDRHLHLTVELALLLFSFQFVLAVSVGDD